MNILLIGRGCERLNKKVWTAMLVLTVVFLCFLYVAKIFFPQEFVMCIENERLIQIGNFIDNHRLIYYVFCAITSFITYYLYCGACCKKLKFNFKEILFIICTIVGIRLINFVDVNIATHLNISSFIFIPAILKGDLKLTSITYLIHGLAQILSLSIRNLPMYLSTNNTVIIVLLSIDMYFWLLLLFIIFNYKKEE